MHLIAASVDDVHTAGEREQFEAFLGTHRRQLNACLDGLTDDEARRQLVPSGTTFLGLVKHATYMEHVWFDEAVNGIPRLQQGLPAAAPDSFNLSDSDTVTAVQNNHRLACEASVRTASRHSLDDIVTGHRFGPLSLRWIYLHLLRELAQHAGHADILREQLLDQRG
jgi:hypothetical protein